MKKGMQERKKRYKSFRKIDSKEDFLSVKKDLNLIRHREHNSSTVQGIVMRALMAGKQELLLSNNIC